RRSVTAIAASHASRLTVCEGVVARVLGASIRRNPPTKAIEPHSMILRRSGSGLGHCGWRGKSEVIALALAVAADTGPPSRVNCRSLETRAGTRSRATFPDGQS